MRLSELQSKKIVDIDSGSNVGNVVDINITSDGKIESFIVDVGKSFLSLNRESDIPIYWNKIIKIGEDFILVKKDS